MFRVEGFRVYGVYRVPGLGCKVYGVGFGFRVL